jgi:hypothetical protein
MSLHAQNKFELGKIWASKVDNKSIRFRTPTWESQGKVTFGCSLHGETHSIL